MQYVIYAKNGDSEWVRWLSDPHPNRENAEASVARLYAYDAPGWEFEVREIEV